MTPRAQAILYRFTLFLLLGEIPAAQAFLSSPTPDYKLLGVGLLTGLGAAAEKYLAPQLVTLPDGKASVLGQTAPVLTPTGTVVPVPVVMPSTSSVVAASVEPPAAEPAPQPQPPA